MTWAVEIETPPTRATCSVKVTHIESGKSKTETEIPRSELYPHVERLMKAIEHDA
jgi:hypothetical protein